MNGRALRGVRRALLSPASFTSWCGFAAFACSEAGSTQTPFNYAGASSVVAAGGAPSATGGASVATGGVPNSGGTPLVSGGTGTGGAGSSPGASLTGGSGSGGMVGPGATGGMPALASGGSSGSGPVIGGASAGGSSAAGSGGSAPAGTFKQVAALLEKSCATMSSCHGPGSAQTAFTGPNLYDTLMSKRSIPYCDAPLVVRMNPTGSALYNVIGGHCGNFVMPPSTACKTVYCPTAEDWNMIGSWIAKGAPND